MSLKHHISNIFRAIFVNVASLKKQPDVCKQQSVCDRYYKFGLPAARRFEDATEKVGAFTPPPLPSKMRVKHDGIADSQCLY